MIPYYSPHFGFADLLRTAVCTNAEQKLIDFFRDLTGKDHILVTSSCRSALYLAYMSLGRQGMVHVSPLTCQVALWPITASGNKIRFHDIKADDWTLDPDSVARGIGVNSLAIQAIHLGGFPCDIPTLRRIADSHGLVLIEDCAQGFGSSYLGTNVGTLGDISCFTLTKNVFGLGGGILATDNHDCFQIAQVLQARFAKESRIKLAHRTVRAMLGSGRSNPWDNKAFMWLNEAKKKHVSKTQSDSVSSLSSQLVLPSGWYSRSSVSRIKKIGKLNQTRHDRAREVISTLKPYGFEFQFNDKAYSAYTKLFCIHPDINSETFIGRLNKSGLEAMHLEHKLGVHYQPKLIGSFAQNSGEELCNYNRIHDRLVSIPLCEQFSSLTMEQILISLKRSLP